MIKQKVEYHDNLEIKIIKEFKGDELIAITSFNEEGKTLYKENKELLYIFEYYDNGTKLFYLENKIKNSWERHLYDQDDNKLLGVRSDGVWYESRYDENGKKIYFMNSYGSIHEYGHWGTKYSDTDEPEKLCTFKINFEKTQNKFGYSIK
jgi:hypothetical protein